MAGTYSHARTYCKTVRCFTDDDNRPQEPAEFKRTCNIDLHLQHMKLASPGALLAKNNHNNKQNTIGSVWFFFLFQTGIKWRRCIKNIAHIRWREHSENENPLFKHRSNASNRCRVRTHRHKCTLHNRILKTTTRKNRTHTHRKTHTKLGTCK